MAVADADCCVNHGPALVEALLAEQQQTAVEKFAQRHAAETEPPASRYYRDLLPLELPRPGEQYAFEVDLDACSGCKACVTACHQLNGLEEDEAWRSVGLLHGGTSRLPVVQHVTAACHHCLEPACLHGCPVNAYEKDPLTGIVRHLDDQCIGCQYCVLMCPYDVPKYSRTKGIVRKCDMCRQRLAVGEPPACVQACPNRAIRITLVDQLAVAEESEANLFLPGAPEPRLTLPTTCYKTRRPLARNLLPADYFSAAPQQAHLALVFMLVLTQMSVGAFAVEQALWIWLGQPRAGALEHQMLRAAQPVHLLAALALGACGLGAAVFHLGRPRYAFRAWIGLKRSWLSREIVAFGLFALLASAYAGWVWLAAGPGENHPSGETALGSRELTGQALGSSAALAGVAAVICSVMIYARTRRPLWSAPRTAARFFLTALVLGLPAALMISLLAAACSARLSVAEVMSLCGRALCGWLAVAMTLKLVFEASIFLALAERAHTPLKRTALLMAGDLGPTTVKRFFLGLVGGVVLPGLLAAGRLPGAEFSPLFVGLSVALLLAALVSGELLERYLFFAAVDAPRMPGTVAS